MAGELEKDEELLFRILSGEDLLSVRTSPAMLRLAMRKRSGDCAGGAPENSRDFQEWLNHLPFTAASMCVTRSSLESGGDLDFNLGFIATPETVERLGIRRGNACAFLPQRRCLYAVLEGSDTDFHNPARFLPALEEIAGRGLSLSGDPYTRMLGVFDAGRGMLRYDEAWFPVD